ncbi:MAG TPA: glycosyltransferase [Propionibacteriaceae bacterium]
MPIERVRLYHRVRSAHLERAKQLPRATILYGDKRYDFDEGLASRLDLVHARSWRAAVFLFRHQVAVLEINEPLTLYSARFTALALLALRLRRLLGLPRTRVVTYAIENRAPEPPGQLTTPRQWLSSRLDRALMRLIWRRVDRVAFGTESARVLYASSLPQGRRSPQTRLFAALPAAAADADAGAKEANRVTFLGAFVHRKGFALLTAAWPAVLRQLPDARLTLIGKGPLEPTGRELAASSPGVELHIDPSRQHIKDTLRRTQVLVLASQRQPDWREQVGLPIVEGLAYGCTIVATTETGLASWLAQHGHRVIPAPCSVAQVEAAVVAALRRPLAAARVLASLPEDDGRLAADAWLFEPSWVANAPESSNSVEVAADGPGRSR